jgi:3-oxoadipate enol-lactonase
MRSIEVPYEFAGPVDAPVLVLSGPLGSTLEVWEPLAERLAERFRVLRYDHRGHGRSPWRASQIPDDGPVEVRAVPYGSYTVVNMAFDVLALLDRLGIEKVAFCGVELGGLVGMWLAAHVPERVSSLVLASTSAHYGVDGPWNDLAWSTGLQGTGGIAADVVARSFSPEWAAAHPGAVEQAIRMVTETTEDGFAECCIALAAWDARKLLGRILTPTLVLTPGSEAGRPDPHAKALATAILGAKLKVLNGAGLGVVEQADQAKFLISVHTKKSR